MAHGETHPKRKYLVRKAFLMSLVVLVDAPEIFHFVGISNHVSDIFQLLIN
jgi:hypothetical protein